MSTKEANAVRTAIILIFSFVIIMVSAGILLERFLREPGIIIIVFLFILVTPVVGIKLWKLTGLPVSIHRLHATPCPKCGSIMSAAGSGRNLADFYCRDCGFNGGVVRMSST